MQQDSQLPSLAASRLALLWRWAISEGKLMLEKLPPVRFLATWAAAVIRLCLSFTSAKISRAEPWNLGVGISMVNEKFLHEIKQLFIAFKL
jgi:hypothetical protein